MSAPQGDDGFDNADVQLFESGNLADSVIVCGTRKWYVHKLILSSRCKWFKAAFYGNLIEAQSGRVILREQDPDLIDIMLRFIYAKDIDIPKLSKGKNVPALCVQLFRVGDFFQLDKLKHKATNELQGYFQDPEKFLITASDPCQRPKWLTDILDALEDAYKDKSTASISQTLVKMVYENKTRIFRFRATVGLLDKIPQIATDLMKNHIIGDFAKSKSRLGLRVISAVKITKGSEGPDVFSKGKPCVLYPHVSESYSSPFLAVDPAGGKEIDGLEWMVPDPAVVETITSHPDCAIGKLRMRLYDVLYIRFEHCGDAALWVEQYCHKVRRIQPEIVGSSAVLFNEMRALIAREF